MSSPMNATELYANCSSMFNVDSDLPGLLLCLTEGTETFATDAADNAQMAAQAVAGTLYLLLAGTLVFFMQPGFAMLCAGCIRAKNVRNVILWNLLDSCGGGVMFYAVGWAFIFGGDDPTSSKKTFIGNTDFFPSALSGTNLAMWFYQFCFSAALSSIVAGTIAERTQMKAYLMYSTFLCGFVYPVVAHGLWSYNGWLSPYNIDPLFGSGAIDFAGSGAVHMTGGVAALMGGIILGPRKGRFYDEDGNKLDEPHDFPPHSVALQFLGTFALWFGWFGFNSGSSYGTSAAEPWLLAALTIMNTTLAACTGALSAMFSYSLYDWHKTGIATYDTGATMNGCLTGLAAITSGCGTVDTWGAFIIGTVSGIVYLIGQKTVLWARIDDAVDAVAVHMFGGAWGLLGTGLLSTPQLVQRAFLHDHAGWFCEWHRSSANFALCGCQLLAILFCFAWTSVVMGAWFFFLNAMGWYRVDPMEEEVGLDQSRHKGAAYDIGHDAPEDTVQKFLSDRASSHGKGPKMDDVLNVSNHGKEQAGEP